MATPLYVTGAQKYVEFSPGHAIVNGVVLYINDPIRINDSQLTDAPGGTGYGDYYVFLAPNRLIMEAYYSKNWQVVVKSTTSAGPIPPTNPDEFLIAKITKVQDGSGNTQLTCTELNRGAKLIGSKDISDGAVGLQHFAQDMATQVELDAVNARMPSVVTATLPSNPVDGQIIYFQDAQLAAQSIVWTFRYRQNSTQVNGYKWELIGGSYWASGDFPNRASFNTAAIGTYTDMASGGVPAVNYVTPYPGVYDFGGQIHMQPSGATGAFQATPGGNGTSFSNNLFRSGNSTSLFNIPISGGSGIGAGVSLTLLGSTNNVACNLAFSRTRLTIRAVCIGP